MTPVSIVAGLAVLAWLVAVVAALRLMRHRLPGRTAGWYAVRGHTFFNSANFTPEGAPAHRVFILGAAGFALALVGLLSLTLGSLQ